MTSINVETIKIYNTILNNSFMYQYYNNKLIQSGLFHSDGGAKAKGVPLALYLYCSTSLMSSIWFIVFWVPVLLHITFECCPVS